MLEGDSGMSYVNKDSDLLCKQQTSIDLLCKQRSDVTTLAIRRERGGARRAHARWEEGRGRL